MLGIEMAAASVFRGMPNPDKARNYGAKLHQELEKYWTDKTNGLSSDAKRVLELEYKLIKSMVVREIQMGRITEADLMLKLLKEKMPLRSKQTEKANHGEIERELRRHELKRLMAEEIARLNGER